MTRRGLWLLGALALVSFARAEQIHKCVGPDGVVYQNLPCAAGHQERSIETIGRNASSQIADAGGLHQTPTASTVPSYPGTNFAQYNGADDRRGVDPRRTAREWTPYTDRRDANGPRLRTSSRYSGTPFAATTLFIGMTDTQVLNLPGWGRPTRISRSRGSQGWREEWVYKNASDEASFLYFQNGRLVEREDAPVPMIEARAAIEN